MLKSPRKLFKDSGKAATHEEEKAVMLEGYLIKDKRHGKMFNRGNTLRYFVLHEDRRLVYYVDEKKRVDAECIDLSTTKELTLNKDSLVVEIPQRRLVLHFDPKKSTQSLAQWYAALSQLLPHAQQQGGNDGVHLDTTDPLTTPPPSPPRDPSLRSAEQTGKMEGEEWLGEGAQTQAKENEGEGGTRECDTAGAETDPSPLAPFPLDTVERVAEGAPEGAASVSSTESGNADAEHEERAKLNEQPAENVLEEVSAPSKTPNSDTTSLTADVEVELWWPDASAESVELRFDVEEWETSHIASRGEGDRFVYRGQFTPFQPLQFKFVVDGEWRTADTYATTSDPDGNTNNCVVPVALEWCGSGTDVRMKGSVDGWSREYVAKREGGKCVVHLTAPHTGKHEFKWIVDGEWCVSANYPTTQSGAAENNYFEC